MVVPTRQEWSLKHLNVKIVFLNGDRDEVVHMEIPQGPIISKEQQQQQGMSLKNGHLWVEASTTSRKLCKKELHSF